MKISLIAALTTDGFIARSNSEFAMWTSKADKQRFVSKTKSAGVMILGSKTFDTFPRPLPGRTHIIYSRNPEKYTAKLLAKFSWDTLPAEIQVTNSEPRELVTSLAEKGTQEIIVCGGSEIYSLFISARLINTLYLTIEPVIFGSGISLFNKSIDGITLQLISEERTVEGTIFTEYAVVKQGV